MTLADIHVSISEISNFLKCRQLWDFSSANRQSLRHKTTPALYLTEGTGLHMAIEAAVNGEDPYGALLRYIETERKNLEEAHRESTGFQPWLVEMEAFMTSANFTRDLVKQYFTQYPADAMLADQNMEYLAAEVSYKIPLPGFPNVYFVGTFDGIAVDEQGNLWVVEHKTYGSKPDCEDLQYHFQANGYAVAFEWLTGMPLTGVLYDGVAKTLIKQPAVLKNGTLSTDKRQMVTLQGYLDALRDHRLDPFDARYVTILTHLQDREQQGDSRFFHREKIFYNEHQVQNWSAELLDIIQEMLDSPRIYRTVPYNGCGPRGQGCWFRDLCHTKHSGGDLQHVLDSRYLTGTYGTMEAVAGVEPVVVDSVPALKEFLRKGIKP